MAYTGILVRAATFNAIYTDPPIAREIAMAGEHIGVGTNTSQIYWLNTLALSKIGLVYDENGNSYPGFKTSALPITYDAGYLQDKTDHLLVDLGVKFRYAPLGALEVLDDSNFKFGSKNIDVEVFSFITGKPNITALSNISIVVEFTQGEKVLIYNETTEALLGEITSSGGSLTFSAQTIGDDITAQAVDTSYNLSAKAVEAIV